MTLASNIKEASCTRSELLSVHQHCPDRPYVELEVPHDAARVLAVIFTAVSRDQGWADTKTGPSFTWFDTTVWRPDGRPGLFPLTVMNNRLANPELYEQSVRFDQGSGIRRQSWLQALQAGDLIQLVPMANYPCWVNIVKECKIKIEYEAIHQSEAQIAVTVPSNKEHYVDSLDHEHHEIRILEVEPGSFDDPICGQFIITSLSKGADVLLLDYHALSYCWGQFTDRVDIEVGSKSFSVSRNVEAAIRRLRPKTGLLRIWIDAVCIDQENLDERARQVRMMGHIYSRATAVHIWLCESSPGIETCLHLVRDIYNFNNRLCPGGEHCVCDGTRHSIKLSDVTESIRVRKENGDGETFRGMQEIFSIADKRFTRELVDLAGGYCNTQLSTLMTVLFEHPWFSRVWVIQEALLARQAWVHCGAEIVPWEELVTVNSWMDDPLFKTQQPHLRIRTVMPPVWKALNQALAHATSGPGQWPDADADADGDADANAADGKEPKQLSTILDVFLGSLDLQSTDPRDKLFALLSFGAETSVPRLLDETIKPNYDKPAEHVFADFTRWWIRTHKSLDILSAVHCQRGRAWRRTLGPDHDHKHSDERNDHVQPVKRPTWAISSEGVSRFAPANLQAQFSFRATDNSVPDAVLLDPGSDQNMDTSSLSPSPLTLRLRGWLVSEITALGYPPFNDTTLYPFDGKRNPTLSDFTAVFTTMFDPCGLTGFWGSINMNKAEPNHPGALALYRDHLRAHWRYFEQAALPALRVPTFKAPDPRWFGTNTMPACLERCFFITADGRCGLCPWTAREGDVVALLAGGSVPYLLRPTRRFGDEDGAFEFVGECFVDGLVWGEFLQDWEASERAERVFDLV